MPKTEENLAILKDRKGGDVALKGVKVRGRLHGLMAEVEVEQSYANLQKTNIEAIYTFPLPLGATLLGLEVEIAGKKLTGSVVEKKQAERQYEDAITDGDSAIMLEETGPGLYTVSLGNLMAGESAVIRYRYALLLSWQGDRLRFLLPTTIAPRYGNPQAAGLQPHQVPNATLNVDHPLEISVMVEGELASATIASPSHQIAVQQSDSGMMVRLTGKAYLDRDFILTIQSDTAQSSCVQTPDREKQVALASLRIPPISGADELPLALKVVIDCSGSMAGTSIAQARKAALGILNQLRPTDSFNLTRFGDDCVHFSPTLVMASAQNITEAWNRLEMLNANMGGTEMEKALDSVFSIGDSENRATVLLITDGEIHEHEKLVQRARQSGHRIFTVGVGNAVAETFLRTLANVTGGACELIAPQEGMSERVLTQFHRMRQPKLGKLRIEWPVTPEWQTPLPDNVFAGDTVQIFAGFSQPVKGAVKLVVQGAAEVTSTIVPANEAEIPRMAASRHMEWASEDVGLQLALEYQLLSRWTNFLVVAERADKAEGLPILHQVPQMLAAGWGGVGVDSDIKFCISSSVDSIKCSLSGNFSKSSDIYTSGTPADFIANLENKYSSIQGQVKLPRSITELYLVELDADVAQNLRELVSRGNNEAEVATSFLYALSKSVIGEKFSRSFKRVIHQHWKLVVKHKEIDAAIQQVLALVTADAWGWPSQVVESGLTSEDVSVRRQFAESLDYKPTPEQIERGMLDEDGRVRAAFASRAHHIFTPEQLERALTDENVPVRKYATIFKNYKPTPFQLERGLKDESPVIRKNIVQHFGDLLTPEQIERGLKDEDVDVRHCFVLNEDIDLSPEQIKRGSKDENIRIQIAIASRYNLNAYAKRQDIILKQAQIDRGLMNEAEATRSKTVGLFPRPCNNSHVEISSRDYWFKIVEFLQQNWALIDSSSDGGCTVFFFGDTSGIFDRLTFPTVAEAEKALHRNGFARFADDKKAKEFIAIPQPPFKQSTHPNGPIYSSGQYWVGD